MTSSRAEPGGIPEEEIVHAWAKEGGGGPGKTIEGGGSGGRNLEGGGCGMAEEAESETG